MLGFTHALIGMALCKLLHLSNNFLELGLAAAFAVLPDIDHPSSLFGTLLRPVSAALYSRIGHRAFTHSAVFMAIVLTPMLFTPYFLLAFTAIASHLFSDAITHTGIPLLWPFNRNLTVLGGAVTTGSWAEYAISIICLGVVLIC